MTLGDGEDYFRSAIDQAGSLSSQASGPRQLRRKKQQLSCMHRVSRRPGGGPARRSPRWLSRLTERAVLSGSAETLQQSVSANYWRQSLSLPEAPRCRRPPFATEKTSAPVSPQPPWFGRRRVCAGRADVLALLFAIIETGVGVLCQPGARNRDAGFGAHDHDRPGAERRLHPGAVQERRLQQLTAMFDCVNGSPSTCRAIPRSAASTSPIRSTRKNFTAEQLHPGGPGDIVVVRLFYQWPLLVTGLASTSRILSGSKRLLTATAAFQNEPY